MLFILGNIYGYEVLHYLKCKDRPFFQVFFDHYGNNFDRNILIQLATSTIITLQLQHAQPLHYLYILPLASWTKQNASTELWARQQDLWLGEAIFPFFFLKIFMVSSVKVKSFTRLFTPFRKESFAKLHSFVLNTYSSVRKLVA